MRNSKTREEVYKAIDSERDYQDLKWGHALDSINSVGDFLAYMKRYFDEAIKEVNPNKPNESLNNIRKIAGLAVACMEQHGVSKRPYV